MSQRYRVSRPSLVTDVIDGEALIILRELGVYYTLSGPGVDAWQALAAGACVPEVVAVLQDRYDGDPAVMADALRQLIADLEREGILAPDPAADPPPPPGAPAAGRRPFAPFGLVRHDAGAVLLPDPPPG